MLTDWDSAPNPTGITRSNLPDAVLYLCFSVAFYLNERRKLIGVVIPQKSTSPVPLIAGPNPGDSLSAAFSWKSIVCGNDGDAADVWNSRRWMATMDDAEQNSTYRIETFGQNSSVRCARSCFLHHRPAAAADDPLRPAPIRAIDSIVSRRQPPQPERCRMRIQRQRTLLVLQRTVLSSTGNSKCCAAAVAYMEAGGLLPQFTVVSRQEPPVRLMFAADRR